MADEPSGGGSVSLTPRRALGVAALFGALAGWLVKVIADALDLTPPQVPWTAPIAVLLIGGLVAVLAYNTHQRIQVRHEWVEPQRAVAFLVLGKASALAGSLIAGGFLTYLLAFVFRVDADAPRDRVIRSAIAVVAGIGLAIAGLRLERACKVPRSGEDNDPEHEGER